MDIKARSAPEPRKAMMAIATISWEDRGGVVHTLPARIEDMSASGACLRVKIPVEIGSRIHVAWCRGEFSGTTKYCRTNNWEYLVGMQQDTVATPSPEKIVTRPILPAAPILKPAVAHHKDSAKIHAVPAQQGDGRRQYLAPIPAPAPPTLIPMTFPSPEIHRSVVGFEIASNDTPCDSRSRKAGTVAAAKFQNGIGTVLEETTDMQNKWLNMGSRRPQQDAPKAEGNGSSLGRTAAVVADSEVSSPAVDADSMRTTPRGDLLSLDDIYRSAGIVAPRLGYSITKVVQMLNSDHLRGLADEVKRASVLMALNAAGIPLGDILQDAAQRQSAVASYESDQRKKFEEYWARRAEENSLLQAEMERVTRQYVERMNRNLNEVAQEKDAFQKWQVAMQQEVQQISAAASLCAQPASLETPLDQVSPGSAKSLAVKSA